MTAANCINYAGPSTIIVPWMSWNYFVFAGGNAAWSQSTSLNGSPYTGPSQSYGLVPIRISQAGTYRFCVNYQTFTNQAIITFVINGVTTNINAYDVGNTSLSFAWTQVLDVGEYMIELNNLTKDPLSADYQMLLNGDGLLIALDTPIGP